MQPGMRPPYPGHPGGPGPRFGMPPGGFMHGQPIQQIPGPAVRLK